MISIFAPSGIGEVGAGDDLAALVLSAVARDAAGPLAEGDLVVVTSKIVSKAEGRTVAATSREDAITAETVRTVARRGPTRIVRTRHGLTLAAAGVDNSNVARGQVLLLPQDPDASAERLCAQLRARTGVRVGVIVSDTAGRAWRHGQTDQAIGVAGVAGLLDYAGQVDAYGNDLQVTAMAVADELAAAADLAKTKLAGRPVAVIRGLGQLVVAEVAGGRAADLVREQETDLFGWGSQEAVLAAVLAAYGQLEEYERLVGLEPGLRTDAALQACGVTGEVDAALRAVLEIDLAQASQHSTSG